MKKTGNIVYIVICLFVCVLPFAGMTVYRTDTTTENKTLASLPEWTKDGAFNKDFFEELSSYFEDHFAFRQELVSADAEIQSKVFGVSNVDTVMVGEKGWLYYTDTVDNFLGQNTMTERQVYNTVHNLSLLQQYVTENGAKFVFTVAPNKNSLYGENMPYYASYKASDVKNINLLTPKFAEAGINYVDLYEPFQREDEVLYLKRDSHWNNKGAVLAYDTILDSLMLEHENYETVTAVREEKEYGDLNKMLYPLTAQPEWNYYYQNDSNWSYVSEDENVEAAWIETENSNGEGSLLMFRDSFGNTLLPLMAEQFATASFSKSTPYRIAEYMESSKPDLVIVEKVERNLDEYMTEPPIMPAPEVSLENGDESDEAEASQENVAQTEKAVSAKITAEEAMEDTDYWKITGEIGNVSVETETPVYIRITSGDVEKCYEAFTTTTENSDFGYQLYLKKADLQAAGFSGTETFQVDVIVENQGKMECVETGTMTLGL
jgi:hypothetical protein